MYSTGQARAGNAPAKRKDIASILQKSEKTVAALLAAASQAILGVDRQGHIVLANARTEEMFGYTRKELLGSTIEILLPHAIREAHVQQRAGYFTQPRVRPMGIGIDLCGRRKDGAEFPVEVSLSYVETEEGMFAIAVVSDISQRKQLEEQLRHAQKMEAVGRLAGGVAHDFNNMLTIVSGYSRMIWDQLPADHALRGYAAEVLKAADRAAALTNQLLAFSRRQIIKPRVMNVNALLTTAERMMQGLIGEDVELVLSLNSGIANIKADSGYIEQAIFNLVVNSRDAMPAGGRITIGTANAYLDRGCAQTNVTVQPGDYVMITVSDTGQGMDAKTKHRIFEPYFTTKEKGKGTGLGLATVYGIVKQSGGDIWVDSELGKGTTFKLLFPAVLEPVMEAADPGAVRAQPRGAEVILVVEDEECVRGLIATVLRESGYKVLTASSGEEAIGISRSYEGAIAMLLTDVVMPEMSGKQLAEAVTSLRPDTKTLYLSGYAEDTVAHHGVLDAGVDFVVKPFNPETLGAKIREVLRKPAADCEPAARRL